MAKNDRAVRIGKQDAEDLISSFVPMFKWLDENRVDYCLVGGLAVLLQCIRTDETNFRATIDADIMFDSSFTNAGFARAYLDVYAADPKYSKSVYEAVFGDGAFEELSTGAQSLINASFIGADADLDGISTPDFDVVRHLNGIDLKGIGRERVDFKGCPVKVATVEQLLLMKEATINILHADITTTSRPQDFIDAMRLKSLIKDLEGRRK
jgi:hypothetical protein